MMWVAIASPRWSTWITHLVGRRLVPINFDRLRFEADFRYGLVRFRDNVEAVVFSRGEESERLGALGRFGHVIDELLAADPRPAEPRPADDRDRPAQRDRPAAASPRPSTSPG